MKFEDGKLLPCLVLSLLLFWQMVSAAFAATAQVKRYGDWELICKEQMSRSNVSHASKAVIDYSGVSCRLQQAQAISGSNEVAFLVNFVMQDGRTLAIISTPLNVYLPAGVDLKIDTGRTQRAMFETCSLSGCHVGFVVDQKMLSGFRKGSSLLVTLRNSKSTEIPVRVSLKGVSDGLDALNATHQ